MTNVVPINKHNEFYQAELQLSALVDTYLLEADFAATTRRAYRLTLDALIKDLGDSIYIYIYI